MNVVDIGGGSGLSALIRAQRKTDYPNLRIKAGVSVTDDGRSAGVHRKYYYTGKSPTGALGDWMQVALAASPHEESDDMKWLAYRYPENGGPYDQLTPRNAYLHSNLELIGLEKTIEKVTKDFSHGDTRVYPVSAQSTELAVKQKNGEVIKGQHKIAKFIKSSEYKDENSIVEIYLEPPIPAYEPLLDAIGAADICFLGPGSFFHSTLAGILPVGITDALRKTPAKIVLVLNLMIIEWETTGFRAENFIRWIEEMIGREVDLILHSALDPEIPQEIANKYAWDHMVPVTLSDFKQISAGKPKRGQYQKYDVVPEKRIMAMPLRGYRDGVIVHDTELLKDACLEIFQRFSR